MQKCARVWYNVSTTKLQNEWDLPVFEKNILPGFGADQLQQAAQPETCATHLKLGYRSLPSPRKQVQVYWWEYTRLFT